MEAPPLESSQTYDQAASAFGELYVRYPRVSGQYALHIGQTVLAGLQFSVILNEIAVQAAHACNNRDFSVSEAARYYRLARSWFEGLPQPLSPFEMTFPHHIKLQYVKPCLHRLSKRGMRVRSGLRTYVG